MSGSTMKDLRISLLTLMIIVALVAVNLTAARAMLPKHRDVLPGCVLSGLALQFALAQVCMARGRARVFWAGFVASGALALASLLFLESRYWIYWYRYFVWAGGSLKALPELSRWIRTDHRALLVAVAVIVFLPQFLVALTGGVLALFARRGFAARAGAEHPSAM
jgi:hypothetical protein